MPSLGMNGPYNLTEAIIDLNVGIGPGNYGLGHVGEDGIFIVRYVGRSDTDLNSRLKDWVGKYKQFKYSQTSSREEAFKKECKNFHDFDGVSGLDNDIHPDRPDGRNLECPVCRIFD